MADTGWIHPPHPGTPLALGKANGTSHQKNSQHHLITMKAERELRLDKNGSCSDTTLEASRKPETGNGRPWEKEREKQMQMKPHRSLQININGRRDEMLFYSTMSLNCEPQIDASHFRNMKS
ncbi:hypothetical protein I7I51_05424 [Histoplasma capsulatum]|uniref:Uncharacterized protein n=1 Tax=Ajellomyces capsulatus TaxID=5037 RepID=A0A8A1M7B4_AJECA|nr:hypothetical protein I7I51_05424 [Histoplasma capsulatum]